MSQEFDLLGDPIPEGFGRRGRPAHRPTEEKRRLVIELLAFDWSLERIAAALSVTPPTLRKHYFRELRARAEAGARLEAKLIANLMAQSDAGSPSATDKLLKRLDRHMLEQLSEQVANRGATAEKPAKLGKKEQQRQAAQEVSGIFAPPDAPRTVN